MKEIFYLFSITCLLQFVQCSIRCERGFCEKYRSDPGCTATSEHCVNNATHQGISLLSPTICNCCDFCMPIFGENRPCTVGGAGNGLSVGRCGAGMSCQPSSGGSVGFTCQRMKSACHTAQDEFDTRHDNGYVGALEQRPTCDDKGKYASFTCVPTQTCKCQSEDGERLFGEFLNTASLIQHGMCGCSRLNYKIKKYIGSGLRYPVLTPRCTFDGNFNPVQCMDNICHCVDKFTGAVNGKKEINLETEPISKLSCYDPDLDLFPESPELGPPYNFTSTCMKDMQQSMELLMESMESGYNIDYFSSVTDCLPDGTYSRIRVLNDGSKVCINEFGRKIDNYSAQPDTPQFQSMDCKCALTNIVMGTTPDKPICCKNGNFRPIQCRRGLCRCVDSEGRQTEMESNDVTKLPCYTDTWKHC